MHRGVHFTREAELGDKLDDDGRISAVLSSETPVERSDCVEVLSHASRSDVDLSRAPLPLIIVHDGKRLPLGAVEDLRVDTAARVLRGKVRFGSSPEARQLHAQVREKIVRSVSVGYQLIREISRAGRMTRYSWRPLEVSAVAVPADPNAQFFRSQNFTRITMDNTNAAGDASRQLTAGDREAERLRAIIDIGGQYARYVSDADVRRACQQGHSLEQFRETVMSRMESGHTDTREQHIGMTPREVQRFSIMRAVAAVVSGDWRQAGFERECSEAVAKMVGRSAEGFYVPTEAWGRRDFSVGTPSEAGNLVATDLRTDLYVDALREALVLAGLGVKILPGLSGNVDVPRKATPGSLGMLTEIGSASETAPVTAKVSLTPKRIGAFVEYSKQSVIQSGLALEPMLRDDLVTGAAVLLEYQMLNGAGTGAEMRGIRNTSGIGTVVGGTSGAAPDWASVIALESKAADANAVAGPFAGYVINSKTRGKLKLAQKGSNLDFVWPDAAPGADGFSRLNGHRVGVTNNLPSTLTKGTSTTVCSSGLFSADWSMALLALFGAPDIVVDPFSLAQTGQVRITLNQFADAGVRQPAAFAKIDDWLAG